MKIRITNIPVRIDNVRYYPGDELKVSESLYKTIKSNCIIVDDKVPVVTKGKTEKNDEIKQEELSEDQLIMNSSKYKNQSKDDIMLDLAERGLEFDPNNSKLELYKLLGRD